MLQLLTNFTLEEYGVIGGVLFILFAIIQKQISFSNKMAMNHAKQREEDLDKISAALIIIQERADDHAKSAEKIANCCREATENHKLLSQDMSTIKDILISKIPNPKQS